MTPDDEPNEADIKEGLAAEFVLGTLDADEKEHAALLIGSDRAFEAQVFAWERRLGPLHGLVAPADPPQHVWSRIEDKLPSIPSGEIRLPSAPARPLGAHAVSNIIDLTFRVKRWQTAAGGLGALAAVLAALLVTSSLGLLPPPFRPLTPPVQVAAQGSGPHQLVGVLQRDAASPAFILTVDVQNRAMTVRRVSAETPPGKSYELWLVSNDFPAPRSLGLVGRDEFSVGRPLMYASQTISDATYAVSEEPEGGSPTGFATGPVVFAGKLLDVVPDKASPPR